MRAIYRAVLLTGLATFAPALTACSNFDADKLDVFGLNEKKKLPGERKDVFPGGVPGVTQGIPPEYMRGNQPPPDAAQSLRLTSAWANNSVSFVSFPAVSRISRLSTQPIAVRRAGKSSPRHDQPERRNFGSSTCL